MFDQGEGGLARPLVQENIPIALTDEVNLPRDVMKKNCSPHHLSGYIFAFFILDLDISGAFRRCFSPLLFPLPFFALG